VLHEYVDGRAVKTLFARDPATKKDNIVKKNKATKKDNVKETESNTNQDSQGPAPKFRNNIGYFEFYNRIMKGQERLRLDVTNADAYHRHVEITKGWVANVR
jgi:hypothetical protein